MAPRMNSSCVCDFNRRIWVDTFCVSAFGAGGRARRQSDERTSPACAEVSNRWLLPVALPESNSELPPVVTSPSLVITGPSRPATTRNALVATRVDSSSPVRFEPATL